MEPPALKPRSSTQGTVRRHCRIVLPLALSLSAPLAHAQVPPGAGTLQREAEQAIQPQRPQLQPARPTARPMTDDRKAARVTARTFGIEGASLIAPAELNALLQDLIGQSLTLAELEQAAQRIAQHYRARGWYVRVYLPEQDVSSGHIRIRVVEGRYGGARLDGKEHRAKAAFVESIVTRELEVGQPLSAHALERGLLLANDLAGIRTTGVLEAGEDAGSTRLLLQLEDTPWISGDIGANNQGVKATGTHQLVGGIALNNLSGYGDRLALRALVAENMQNLQFQYSLPLGTAGWRLGIHASALDYELGDRFRPLKAEGQAHTRGLNLTYAWLRRSDRNLNLSAAWEQRRYDDNTLDAPLRRHKVDALTLGLSGDLNDGLGGGGVTWGGLQLVRGQLHIGDVADDRAIDAAGPRTDGNYTKLALQLSRLQSLGASGWQLLAGLSGQTAAGNLGSSEKFSLGGPNGVRAYPVNEGTGDEGVLLKLELQRPLGGGWQASAFYDTGYIRQHRKLWAGWDCACNQPNAYSLSGAGLGLSWQRPGDWTLAASVAAPLGSNPGSGAGNLNNDGSRANAPRFWLNLSKAFL